MALSRFAHRRTSRVPKAHRNPIALAREWEALLADGTYSSRAALARGLGISRAGVTQVLNLLNLPGDVLDSLMAIGNPLPSGAINEHRLRRLAQLPKRQHPINV